jgi:dTDP-4-dehydrorhamnose 3,5-epimerase
MQFTPTRVAGAFVIDLKRIADSRGYFARQWCTTTLKAQGLCGDVAQINTGLSVRKGTLRGMHFQLEPHAEVKIARCPRGAVFDVVLDLRAQSPTFKQWHGEILSGENGRALYLPEGCAHGYLTLEDDSVLDYMTSRPYAPQHVAGARFDDPAFGIQWPLVPTEVSDQDKNWPISGLKD